MVLHGQFNKLTDNDKLELLKLLQTVYKEIKASTNPDIFYSILLHVLNEKIELGIRFPESPEIDVKHKTDNLNEWK